MKAVYKLLIKVLFVSHAATVVVYPMYEDEYNILIGNSKSCLESRIAVIDKYYSTSDICTEKKVHINNDQIKLNRNMLNILNVFEINDPDVPAIIDRFFHHGALFVTVTPSKKVYERFSHYDQNILRSITTRLSIYSFKKEALEEVIYWSALCIHSKIKYALPDIRSNIITLFLSLKKIGINNSFIPLFLRIKIIKEYLHLEPAIHDILDGLETEDVFSFEGTPEQLYRPLNERSGRYYNPFTWIQKKIKNIEPECNGQLSMTDMKILDPSQWRKNTAEMLFKEVPAIVEKYKKNNK